MGKSVISSAVLISSLIIALVNYTLNFFVFLVVTALIKNSYSIYIYR